MVQLLTSETVKHLIQYYQQTEQDCSRVVSDLHLDSISHCCCAGGAWKALAPHLEIERAVVEDIDRKQVDDEEKRSLFFYRWKQMKGSDATYMRFVTALLNIQRRLDAEKVLKLLQDPIGQQASSNQPGDVNDHRVKLTADNLINT